MCDHDQDRLQAAKPPKDRIAEILAASILRLARKNAETGLDNSSDPSVYADNDAEKEDRP